MHISAARARRREGAERSRRVDERRTRQRGHNCEDVLQCWSAGRSGRPRASGHEPGGGLHEIALGEVLRDVVVPLGLQADGIGAGAAALRHVPVSRVNPVEDVHGLRGDPADRRLPGVPPELREVAEEDADGGRPCVRPCGCKAHRAVLDGHPADEVVVNGLVLGCLLLVADDSKLDQEPRHRSVDGGFAVVPVSHQLQKSLRALRSPRRHYPQPDLALCRVEAHSANITVRQVPRQFGIAALRGLSIGFDGDGR
mmetsp:Transcript_97575/g.309456  ORF Transcript_97575/g.309456 Transcript_97575/m.309456 type:complete len:255 (-) Transcript_97575:77-841(-)